MAGLLGGNSGLLRGDSTTHLALSGLGASSSNLAPGLGWAWGGPSPGSLGIGEQPLQKTNEELARLASRRDLSALLQENANLARVSGQSPPPPNSTLPYSRLSPSMPASSHVPKV